MAKLDLDLLAYDIADMLDRLEYPLDVSAKHIRPALPGFIAQILMYVDRDTKED